MRSDIILQFCFESRLSRRHFKNYLFVFGFIFVARIRITSQNNKTYTTHGMNSNLLTAEFNQRKRGLLLVLSIYPFMLIFFNSQIKKIYIRIHIT